MERVTQIIEEVCRDMCTFYCKWPVLWDEEKEGMELCESDYCKECPLNRLN